MTVGTFWKKIEWLSHKLWKISLSTHAKLHLLPVAVLGPVQLVVVVDLGTAGTRKPVRFRPLQRLGFPVDAAVALQMQRGTLDLDAFESINKTYLVKFDWKSVKPTSSRTDRDSGSGSAAWCSPPGGRSRRGTRRRGSICWPVSPHLRTAERSCWSGEGEIKEQLIFMRWKFPKSVFFMQKNKNKCQCKYSKNRLSDKIHMMGLAKGVSIWKVWRIFVPQFSQIAFLY